MFEHRAYMLDISRDRVPTMKTLREIVDLLERCRYNQLQLYTEHTFAYREHSVVWEDAFVAAVFSPEMAQPGSVSAPFASTLGVHILYYLGDSPAGPVELTQEVYDALYYTLYTERYSEAQAQRITELANAAEIVIY